MSQVTGSQHARTEPSTIVTDLPDDTARSVVDNARSLSPDDDRLTDHTGGLMDLSRAMLTTALFDADPHHTTLIPEEPHEWESGTIHLVYQAPCEFPEGNGFVTFDIVADHPTHEIESLEIRTELAIPSER